MRITEARYAAIFQALAGTAGTGQTATWAELQNEVICAGITVRNWLSVRAVLQDLINRGMYTRDASDLTTERYIRN